MRRRSEIAKSKSFDLVNEADQIERQIVFYCGGVAQLGEHLPCTQGVRSSTLLISTNRDLNKSREIK